ncbi:sugar transferase [Sphingomonas sp. TX0543]|uniref:sugar transferase n=1 Tax=unclassified Sphingomonas TaxID=196159 RepID=UPI001BB1EE7B|nr:sugar transferase [Sphingomonas sp. 3P27F8]
MNFTFIQGPGSRFLRLRYQLAGAFIAIFIPYLLIVLTSSPESVSIYLLTKTLFFSMLATILGVILFRSLSQYPGVEANAYTLPSFGISFGLLLAILILARFPYSRMLLFSSFGLIIIWFMFVNTIANRRRILTIGVVPGGDHELILGVEGVRWILLDAPELDTAAIHAVTADLRIDLAPEWDRWLADCALLGIPVYHTKHLAESLTGMVQLEHLSENSFGTLAPVSAFMTIKHLMDWLVAAIAMLFLLPLMAALCIAVRLDSPGPAIFRQTRMGYRGVPFTVYKFRTMHAAPTGASTLHAAKTQSEDSRITRIGSFLRRSRIDELPQIVNILKGEMSWIGPRPEARILSEWYEGEIPFYRYRHIVRPGITGWAQVNQGHVAEVDEVRNKLFFDFYYIKNYSPWIDLLIVSKTVQTVLTGFGAK